MVIAWKFAVAGFAVLVVELTSHTVLAQDAKDRSVEQYTCKDVVRESGPDRDVAIAFLHGFLLGKSGSSKFNLEAMHKLSDDFIERCLDNLSETSNGAMSKVKN
jgi:hypothetical protein